MLPIPLRPTDITPDWLTAELRLGDLNDATVDSVTAEPMQSLTSTMHRLHLGYRETDPALPATLIWKQSSVHPAVRAAYGHYRGSAYEREVRFYREIAPAIRARVPHCYLAEYEPSTDEHVLLLEDLGSTHAPGDLIAGVSAGEAALCLRELALLHAAHWGAPRPLDAARVESNHGYFLQCLAECRAFLTYAVGAHTLEALNGFGDVLVPWASRLNARPLTVIHADAHPGNVLFPVGGDDRVVLVDWQGWREGPPARDVGRSLVLMLSVEERRRSERDLVAEYGAVLRANGVEYNENEAFVDYCIGAANQWIWAVTFASRRDAWDEVTSVAMPGLIRKAAMAALDTLDQLGPDA